ncbi:uncharacterized protein, YkwD family [Evansella caseinilytica]|uniref:Uncharacterized protein, YkwD family n=1 Tax=Evansella caseinilytica TaxID=1503961 RepID=A0A1H3ULY7_9BACI|nr:CAP domain-containing protein [Evansella caseinilytica]SDZ63388.1 uncharacterized protein, YkwD family [Evansella caseinilytica]
MRQKIHWIVIALSLTLTIGCNADNDNAFDAQNIDGIGRDQDSTISSDSTAIPSSEFPHTKAVQIQQAKYRFEIVPGNREAQRTEQPGQQGEKAPNQQQQQAPTDQQQAGQQPGQQERAAAPEETQQKETEHGGQGESGQQAAGISETEQQVINLTNKERQNNGLPELQADTALSNVARKKSEDMRQNNYFSHTSPTYGSPFDMIRDSGVSYNAAAENIAQGQPTPEQVVQAWMNSEGHRQNILNGNYTHIGVGHDENGHYWTQMFISR